MEAEYERMKNEIIPFSNYFKITSLADFVVLGNVIEMLIYFSNHLGNLVIKIGLA